MSRPTCAHDWVRRPDEDLIAQLRYACSRCGMWGHKAFGTRDPVRAYSDGRLTPSGRETHYDGGRSRTDAERRVFTDREGFAKWTGKEVA